MIKDLPLKTHTLLAQQPAPGALLTGTKMPVLNNQKLSYPKW